MRTIRLFVTCCLGAVLLWGSACGTASGEQSQAAPAASPATPDPAHAQGAKVYSLYCVACHMQNGAGIPGMNPPLIKTDWVLGDKERLINVLLKGLNEPIEIDGQVYKNIMPSHAHLSDADIAAVLTYVRASFGNQAGAIGEAEVAAARAKLGS
ncbi:MAG: cytochrome c2 [Bacteroidia bacterium]